MVKYILDFFVDVFVGVIFFVLFFSGVEGIMILYTCVDFLLKLFIGYVC